MTDQTSASFSMAHDSPKRRSAKIEGKIYFALIFFFALPFATITWAFQFATTQRKPHFGPLARARTEAQVIMPIIFSA